MLASLLLLAALTSATLAVAISGDRAAAALEARIADDIAVRAGLQRLLVSIADPADNLEADALADVATLERPGRIVHLAISSEDSKLDVLLVDLDLLQRYARNAGVTVEGIATLRQQLLAARRDRDSVAAVEAMIDTLRGLRSRRELLDDLTMHGAAVTIDPAHASANVLAAIPDLTPGQVGLLLETPPAERAQRVQSRYFAATSRRFSLSAMSVDAAGHEYQRRQIVELSSTGVPLLRSGLF